ncbi:MAG TPA: DnaB-like helicase N-terminal domain-containing protein [Acidothermaceae bacterium]|jgi:replicative DNA helicase
MTAAVEDLEPPIGRTPPQDINAEQAVLGGMMLSDRARVEVLEILSARDFYRPAHETIFAVIASLSAERKPADAVTVAAELMAAGEIVRVGGHPYLHTLISAVPTAANATYYAAIVRDRAILRAVIRGSEHAAQMAYSPDVDAHEIADRAAAEMAAVRDFGMQQEDSQTPNAAEFMAQPMTYDWLVPGLLERGDRLIVTGNEGLGKSMLIRQIAVCVSAGLHPFDFEPIDPQLVLIVDCENGSKQVNRMLQSLEWATKRYDLTREDWLLWIETRPSGINLLDPADRRWLLRKVEQHTPALLSIGPVYKLHDGDPDKEEFIRKVQRVLDDCRAMGCTLLMEHHAGHGDSSKGQRPVRPSGSSLWLRWPEFGYGLRLASDEHAEAERLVDLVPWRGPREERTWPKRLRAGSPWPWVAA